MKRSIRENGGTQDMVGVWPNRIGRVESYLNQNMQAADWVASITGRLWAHRLQSEQYEDHQKFSEYYWQRLHQLAVHSAVNRRGVQRRERRNENTALGIALTKVGFNPS